MPEAVKRVFRKEQFNHLVVGEKVQTTLLSFLFLFLLSPEISAQTSTSLTISNSTLVSTSEKLPLWLWANTDGKTEEGNDILNLSEVDARGAHFFNDSNLTVKVGATLNYGIGNNSRYVQANQLFTRINFNNWELSVGMYHNDLFFEGLSTSNGNIAKSRNARPLPRISVRVSEYKPVPFLTKTLFFKGEYDEGFLTDDRYVDNAHLHHKSFYLRLNPFRNFSIAGGVEHFVMWGGTSRNEKIGELPSDCAAYLRYITGSPGDSTFLLTDQANVAGNQYGTYQIMATKKFRQFEASINISHPFEDFSGVNLRNWPDNIIGLLIQLNDPDKFITHFIYEFTNTRQQSIKDSLYFWSDEEQKWGRYEVDNYFNHSIYNSGVTYYRKASGSPLFFPVKVEEGISRGFESNRFFAHHIGLEGKILESIKWKSLVTYIQHIGTWRNVYDTPHNQISILLDFTYTGKTVPLNIGFTIADDITSRSDNNLGVQLKFQYRFQ